VVFGLRTKKSAFVRFLTKGVQKHHEQLFGENPCQKPLAEKLRKKRIVFLSSFPIDYVFIAFFGRFSAREAQKHH
jgi:hypothetical protein